MISLLWQRNAAPLQVGREGERHTHTHTPHSEYRGGERNTQMCVKPPARWSLNKTATIPRNNVGIT